MGKENDCWFRREAPPILAAVARGERNPKAESPLFDRLLRIVKWKVMDLDEWLDLHVEGYHVLSTDERRNYAVEITRGLIEDFCLCGHPNCVKEHRLRAWLAQNVSIDYFVRRAVQGPKGKCTNSIAQGMMFPRLHDEKNLRVVLAQFHECHQCGWQYEGRTCPICKADFNPAMTRMLGKDWLIIEEFYTLEWRWGCGQEPNEHYYDQDFCQTEINDILKDTYHVVCSRRPGHDRCPWKQCPDKPARHRQRATSLRVRASFEAPVARGGHPPQRLLDGIAEGMLAALGAMSAEDQRRLFHALGDDPLAIAEDLATDAAQRKTLLPDADWEKATRTIRTTLEHYGVDGEMIDRWFRGHDPKAEAWEVNEHEQLHDDR